MFLEDYFRFPYIVPLTITKQILAAVQATPGTTIAATLASIPGIRANDIYAIIATEQLYVDLYAVPLVEHWRVQLWADGQTHTAHIHLALGTTGHHQKITSPTTLLPNTLLVWDSQKWTLVNLGETTTTLLPEVGQPMQVPTAFFLQLFDSGTINIHSSEKHASINSFVRELMEAASPADLQTANRRFHIVQAYFQHHTDIGKDIPQSTLSRWVKQFREAEAKFGCGYVGLLPRTNSRGNRQPKAPTDASKLLDKFITEHFETPRQAPAASVYRAYTRACCSANIPPLSQRTFYTRLKQRPIHEQTLKTSGRKSCIRNRTDCFRTS